MHSTLSSVGGSMRMSQFFHGSLAGLMIRSGKLENKKVIDCLYTCKEGLYVQLPEEVAASVKVRGLLAPGLLVLVSTLLSDISVFFRYLWVCVILTLQSSILGL